MAAVDYDVIIAGGGVAGVAAAAALREFGWSVLIVEPGQHSDRRLGGELIHPAGVAALQELGLYTEKVLGNAVPIAGFVAVAGSEEDWADIRLPYSPDWAPGRAIALDHAQIRAALQEAAMSLPHVTMLKGARVVGLDTGQSEPRVAIEQKNKVWNLTCRLVVAADGAASSVRSLAGIAHWRRPISAITGYLIGDANLPAPGFGHVFIGASAPLLIYEIGAGRARVLFDQPIGQSGVPPHEHRELIAAAIAHPALRAEVMEALKTQRGLRFVSADVVVERSTRNRVVLVGDAGGSCHPLTATGMTIGVNDALRLRDALRDAKGDIPAMLTLYSRRRLRPQRTRLLVASALHDACSATRPELKLIRAGLIRYWTRDERGRQASMALLAMNDLRLRSALREMLTVIRHGIAAQWQAGSAARLLSGLRVMAGLTGVVMRQLSFAMRAR